MVETGKSSLFESCWGFVESIMELFFSDRDFYNGNIENFIQIEADIVDLPEKLFDLESIGLSCKLKRKFGEITTNIEQEEDGDLLFLYPPCCQIYPSSG